ncbi:unnamed protein product [Spirodela intermedia]|uniref:DUF7138 domain-containing protein n=1 Tax=Spirodela intermedia TaxID=51605 RepID=A0A7I8JE95_SPIIN|nr:unnamed protein product [Spirodela intermedia]CAA6668468.1 unnamed protein product [Spirodela intermedia]
MKEEVIPAPTAALSPSDRRVVIDHGFVFEKLQLVVGDMVGVSPDRIALFLLNQRKASPGRPQAEIRRKTPIEEGTDFARIAREKDGAIIVQLKRSRRERRGRSRRDHVVVPEVAILRRPVESKQRSAEAQSIALESAADGSGVVRLLNYEIMKNLQRQRYHLLSSSAASHFPQATVCAICSSTAVKKPVPFHWCVHDRVISEAFRSTAGPIQRPPKRTVVQASA